MLFGDSAAERTPELQGIADWLADWARRADEYGQNLICLGDFNIDREGDPNYEAFASRGLRPPPELSGLPRTIFDDPGSESFYDQIAWFRDGVPRPDLPRLDPDRRVVADLRPLSALGRVPRPGPERLAAERPGAASGLT